MTNPMQKSLTLLRGRYRKKVGTVSPKKVVEDLDNILSQTYHDEEYRAECKCPECKYHRGDTSREEE